MNKFRIKKSLLAIMTIFCICSYSFGAIVSDNDGSAFVSKYEFETLKKDFADQLMRYNDSIDNKIDGVIASYLAGNSVDQKVVLDSLINKINAACSDSYKSGTTTVKYGYRCMAKSYSIPITQKPEGAIVNLFMGNALCGSNNTEWRGGGFARIGMDNGSSRTGLYDVNVPSTGRKTGKFIMFSKYNNKLYPIHSYDEIEYRYYATGSGAAHQFTGFPTTDPSITTVTWTFPQFKIEDNYWKLNTSEVNVHWDGGSGGSWDNIRIFYGGSYKATEEIRVMPIVGRISGSVLGLQKDNLTKMRLQENTYHWTFFPYNCFHTYKYVAATNTWENSIHIYTTQSGVETDFYFNCHPYETVTLSSLIDYDATKAYGEGDVAIYGGLPLFRSLGNGEVTMKITFKSDKNHDVYVGLSTQQFKNDNSYSIESGLELRDGSGNKITSNKFECNKEYELIMDVRKDQVVWIKTYDASDDTGFTGAETNEIMLVEQ